MSQQQLQMHSNQVVNKCHMDVKHMLLICVKGQDSTVICQRSKVKGTRSNQVYGGQKSKVKGQSSFYQNQPLWHQQSPQWSQMVKTVVANGNKMSNIKCLLGFANS